MQTEKQRERLVELLNEATFGVNVHTLADHLSRETIERVAEYLMANNVVVLPFEKGDIVYHLAHGYAEEEIVRCPYLQYLTNGYSFTEEDIGKTVFLSKEEAEAKLREMRDGN